MYERKRYTYKFNCEMSHKHLTVTDGYLFNLLLSIVKKYVILKEVSKTLTESLETKPFIFPSLSYLYKMYKVSFEIKNNSIRNIIKYEMHHT